MLLVVYSVLICAVLVLILIVAGSESRSNYQPEKAISSEEIRKRSTSPADHNELREPMTDGSALPLNVVAAGNAATV